MELNPKARLIQALLPGIAMVEDLSCARRGSVVGENIVGTAFLANLDGTSSPQNMWFEAVEQWTSGCAPLTLQRPAEGTR